MGKAIVIGGGVGPMAGVNLHKAIIENTLTDGTDQSHLEVIHLSRSFDIPDRTEFLVGAIDQNPAEGMARAFGMADSALKTTGRQAVGGIPCNTFHAPVIYTRFLQLIDEAGIKIGIVHMIDETVDMIRHIVPDGKGIGLMSTTGTRQAGVYSQVLNPQGMTLLECPEKQQFELHDSVYNRRWGLKAVSPVTARARDTVSGCARGLIASGARVIILGCTEIALALPGSDFEGTPLIDAVVALARGLIREADPQKLRPRSSGSVSTLRHQTAGD